jgi:hypothetical protein
LRYADADGIALTEAFGFRSTVHRDDGSIAHAGSSTWDFVCLSSNGGDADDLFDLDRVVPWSSTTPTPPRPRRARANVVFPSPTRTTGR